MRIGDNVVPVAVLPSPHHGGLAVTRTLGRLGIRVFNIDGNRWCPSFFSRYSRGGFRHDLDGSSAAESAEALRKFGARIGTRAILIPTTDASARFIADHASLLREQFIFPRQPAPLVHALLSKKRMLSLAQRHRIPVPATLFPQTPAELLASPERVGLPLIVKGISADGWNRSSKSKVLVRALSEFRELCERISSAAIPELMVQEYISGSEDTVWMFNGYFDAGSACRAAFTGRKLRQCPVYTGVASLARSEPNEIVGNQAIDFMKAVRYSGIVDIDFRYDAREDRYKILDVNPRIGSTFRLFVSSEQMDVARAMYLDLTGQNIPAAPMQSGRKWMVEDLDVVAAFRYARENNLTFPDWWKSLRGVDELSFLAADDPVPAALMLLADLRELFSRRQANARGVPPFELKSTPAHAESQVCQ